LLELERSMDRLDAFLSWLKPRLMRTFWFTLALLFLIESWLWDHIKEWLRQLERRLGLERFEPWLEAVVARLSPPAALALFLLPVITILPLKVAALAILAHGHVLTGVALILLAKSLALGVEAFLFDICRDKLLQMQWFRRLYSTILNVRAWAATLVEPYKARLGEAIRRFRAYAASLTVGDGVALSERVARLRALVKSRRQA
jgi:hypothetical protein